MPPIQELMKKKLVFGAWCVFEEELLDEARCRRIRESGLDFGYISFDADHSNALPILDACQRNDLLVIAFDPRVQGCLLYTSVLPLRRPERGGPASCVIAGS